MKVLWIINIVFPEAERLLTGSGDLKASGGWMLGAADALLANSKDISLTVAAVSPRVKVLTKLQGERMTYYLLPYGKGNNKKNNDYIPYWKQISEELKPDIVHIHGTEYSHGLAYVDACGADNVVVSIQGLTSAYYYYYYGLTKCQILRNLTLRDILKGTIIKGQKDFKKRSEYEIELLKKVHHIIGRTSWDRAHTWAINPEAQYHFCNEILRKEFYDGFVWNYDKCEKHTIFLSQAGYPIKGLHQMLRAMPLILRQFPDAKIRVAGGNILEHSSIKDLIKYSGYGRIISSLIKRFHLEGKVEFTGNLNAEGMKHEYLKCNVFVCPSTIENSPNSLGEAQILGVPVVASYVGGIPDMMKGDEEHLYRFEEVEMLADKICKVFEDEPDTEKMRQNALLRHDKTSVAEDLMGIYEKIRNL